MDVNDIEIFATGKYCIFAKIAQILDEQLHITLQNEVSVSDMITNEYYDNHDAAHVLMPGLGKYLD